MIPVPAGTPPWGVALVKNIEAEIAKPSKNPVLLPSFTVATVPRAASWPNCAVIVSNESGGRTIATSDGANWKRVKDGATIS